MGSDPAGQTPGCVSAEPCAGGVEGLTPVWREANLAHLAAAAQVIEQRLQFILHGIRQVAVYSMPNVSDKVLRIIHSYIDYVNRFVWKKY